MHTGCPKYRRVFGLVAVLLVTVLNSIGTAYEWEIEVVDVGKQFRSMSNRSIDVDLDGHPHIAYGGQPYWGCENYGGSGGLYHAWHDGETWYTELLIPGYGV